MGSHQGENFALEELFASDEYALVKNAAGRVAVLSPSAHLIWSLFNSGMSTEEIIQTIETEFFATTAAEDVRSVLIHLRELTTSGPPEEQIPFYVRTSSHLSESSRYSKLPILVQGEALSLEAATPLPRELTRRYFHSAENLPTQKRIQVEQSTDGTYSVRTESFELSPVTEPQLLHALSSAAMCEAWTGRDFRCFLHASALLRGEKGILLPGASGRGKSTLVAYLSTKEFLFHAEENVILRGDPLSIVPNHVPIGLKEGSWQPLAETIPTLLQEPIYKRLDGRSIRFHRPENVSPNRECRLHAIIFPRYTAGLKSSLRELRPVESLSLLLEAGYLFPEQSNAESFSEFVQSIQKLPAYELVFSNLEEASSCLEELLYVKLKE